MNITFYSVSDSPKKLIKDISNVIGTSRALSPTGEINVLNPVVICAYDSTIGDRIINSNYCYIDSFHRYYWVTCSIDTAKRIVVSGKCDYLMSWADGIKSCKCNVIRANLGKPSFIPDKKYPVDTSRFVTESIDFPDTQLEHNGGIITPQYVMITR